MMPMSLGQRHNTAGTLYRLERLVFGMRRPLPGLYADEMGGEGIPAGFNGDHEAEFVGSELHGFHGLEVAQSVGLGRELEGKQCNDGAGAGTVGGTGSKDDLTGQGADCESDGITGVWKFGRQTRGRGVRIESNEANRQAEEGGISGTSSGCAGVGVVACGREGVLFPRGVFGTGEKAVFGLRSRESISLLCLCVRVGIVDGGTAAGDGSLRGLHKNRVAHCAADGCPQYAHSDECHADFSRSVLVS